MSATSVYHRDLQREEIPLVRLDNSDPDLLAELMAAVGAIATTGSFTLGETVARFEHEFASYCGVKHAIGVSSGTEALLLALRALGVGPGDEVVVPANSFIATAEAVSLAGARPRFVDVDPVTLLMTAGHVEEALSERAKAVIAVHLYGSTVDLDPILEILEPRGLPLIEDACQAHGAWYRGRRVGTIGDVGCFSFYPTKNLGAWGDGGAVTTNRDDLADCIQLLRSHGERPRYRHRIVGTTARLDAIQAAVLRVKLRHLDVWNGQRRALAHELTSALADASVVTSSAAPSDGDHVYHLFTVGTEHREALRTHLAEAGIATAVHYPTALHRTEAYELANVGITLPVCERVAETTCTLPLWPGMSSEQLARIAGAVCSFEPPAVQQ